MIYIIAFIFGTTLGSFANVLADRINVKPILNARSECLSCGKKLSWKEMIPILSYLFQRGRCAHCKTKLPPTLLLSEIFSGTIAVIILNASLSFSPYVWVQFVHFIIICLIACISLAIIIYDIRHLLVPYQFIISLILLSVLFFTLKTVVYGINISSLISPFVVAAPFLFLFIISKGRWVGLADVFLYFCFGLILALPAAISMFFYSVWLGAFVSIFLMIVYKKDYGLKTEIPFTPFIIIAFFLCLYIRPDILGLNSLLVNNLFEKL